jgi:excinuclease ABC subunit C
MNKQSIKHSLARFPQSPGVYLMKDAAKRILYIGKAINLRNRVRSYFVDSHDERPQIPVMLKRVDHIDWIATTNEEEALILEANLIREHKPPYNVDLKDDKRYPYLKVTLNEPFPRLLVVRRVRKDGGRYFGPYTDATTMRRLATHAKRVFKIRDCSKKLPLKKPVRPCINYGIGRCSGACGARITPAAYRENVNLLLQLLRGRNDEIVAHLEERMRLASKNLAFEEAASLRDQIALLRRGPRLQRVDLLAGDADADVFGVHEGDRHVCLCVLCFRRGLLMARRHFIVKRSVWSVSRGSADAVVLQFYQERTDDPPREVILPATAAFDTALLERWFADRLARAVRITVPRRGKKCELVGMAERNARLYLAQKAPGSAEDDISDMQRLLFLPRRPETIEAFDISNLGGSFAVAGMVRYREGLPHKAGYRRYKIRTVEGQDDFAMMMEAVTRRLERLQREGKPFPDLLLIDGGKGQLGAASRPLARFDDPPMVVALAKREETLHSPYVEQPVTLPANHPVRRLVERIRDDVHRFAITYHRSIRDKQFKGSSMEKITGIGPTRAAALLKEFGSMKRVREASVEELMGRGKLPERVAREVRVVLGKR